MTGSWWRRHAVYADTEDRLNANPLAQAQLGGDVHPRASRAIRGETACGAKHSTRWTTWKRYQASRAMGQRDHRRVQDEAPKDVPEAMVERIRERVNRSSPYAETVLSALAARQRRRFDRAASVAPAQGGPSPSAQRREFAARVRLSRRS